MIPVQYNLRNLVVRKATTVATALGLGLVVFIFSSVLMLSNGIKRTLGRSASEDVAIVIRKGSDAELASGIEDASVNIVLSSKELAEKDGAPKGVGEVVVVVLLDKLGTTGFSNVQVRGVADRSVVFRPTMKIVEGRAAAPGTDEVIVGRAIAGRFKGVKLGESFELKKNRPATVVGVFEDGGSSYESEVWADLNLVRTAFGREGGVSSVRVRLESPSKFDAFKTSIESNRQLDLEAIKETTYYEKQSEGMATFINALGILIAVFFSVGAMIGAMITMHASIANRQREIGTLRALGFSKLSILGSFLIESVALALIGGAVGALASLLMGMVRFSMMNWATFSEVVFAFEPTPQIIVTSLVVAGIMGLLGGFFPALRAARMSPILAMRG
ncbi:MAG: FtsX-like permease family protein [Polyangiaceae bacterium]